MVEIPPGGTLHFIPETGTKSYHYFLPFAYPQNLCHTVSQAVKSYNSQCVQVDSFPTPHMGK